MPKSKTIAQELEAVAVILQKLVRVQSADDNGYCQCVSCGVVKHWKEMQGGHFISRSKTATKITRENVHTQCRRCNAWPDSTTVLSYRDYMIERYGEDFVENLREESGKLKKWTREELNLIKENLKKELKNELSRLC
jgi:hypothetical protein